MAEKNPYQLIPTAGTYEKGTKHDDGKIRLDLIPPEALRRVGRVFTFGAAKYGDHNWRGGIAYSRLIGAALRHINKWQSGEDVDHESGLPHLAHAIASLMMALCMPVKFDDRYTVNLYPQGEEYRE